MITRSVEDWRDVLVARRRALGMTQAEVAAAAGRTRQWLIRFENGRATTVATLADVLELCAALDVDPYLDPAVDDV